ncbi:hypothetical protein QCD71_16655 [Sphingomonas sp. PsM26]|nr:hypothetical protein [Sphingomonas sp. PsM26]
MAKKDDLILAGVIAVGAAATGFALSFLCRFGIKQESVFALVGALIGAAATIGGAAWLADRNRNLERNAEITLLATEFGKLLRASLAAQEVEPGTNMVWSEVYRPRLHNLAEVADRVHAIAAEALAHGKALSFIHRAVVRRVQFANEGFLQFWTDVNAEGEPHPMDDRSFPKTTGYLSHECKVAIAELNRTTPFGDEV